MDHRTATILRAALVMTVSTPIHAQSWDGFYLGATLGTGAGSYDLGVTEDAQDGPTVDVEGAMFGLRAGRRMQRGNTVLGADFELMNGPSGTTVTIAEDPDYFWNCTTGDCNITFDSLMSARATFGIAVAPQTLIYAAGGLAAAQVEGGIENSAQQGKSTAIGYTVGIGAEQQIPNGMTVFGEVGYYNLGDLQFGVGQDNATFDGVGDFATFKIGVNLRF